MNLLLSSPKIVHVVHLFLHTPFRNKDEAEKYSCKNNKAVRSLARQIKSYFQMRNDRQTDLCNLLWHFTTIRNRRTFLCSETDERSLSSGGLFPSGFRETLSIPQINTSFGFLQSNFFYLWPPAQKGCERSLTLAALVWHFKKQPMSVFFCFCRSRAEENKKRVIFQQKRLCQHKALNVLVSTLKCCLWWGSLWTFSQSKSPVSSLIESLSFPVLSFSPNVYAYVSPVLRATSSESSVCLPFKCSLLQSWWYMKVGTSVMEVAV